MNREQLMTAARVVIDLSICPTALEVGDQGERMNGSLYLAAISTAIRRAFPLAEIAYRCHQIGHRQGDDWCKCWIDGLRCDDVLADIIDEIDCSDENLYAEGGAE